MMNYDYGSFSEWQESMQNDIRLKEKENYYFQKQNINKRIKT